MSVVAPVLARPPKRRALNEEEGRREEVSERDRIVRHDLLRACAGKKRS
jgi:hypothetical protein